MKTSSMAQSPPLARNCTDAVVWPEVGSGRSRMSCDALGRGPVLDAAEGGHEPGLGDVVAVHEAHEDVERAGHGRVQRPRDEAEVGVRVVGAGGRRAGGLGAQDLQRLRLQPPAR